eukprot:scaffold61001_cov27-Tisochrysis_lutea.AAC.1
MLSSAGAWLWRALAVAVSALALLRLGVGVAAWRAAEGLERPAFHVVRKIGRGVEIRGNVRISWAPALEQAGRTGGSLEVGCVEGCEKEHSEAASAH